MHIYSLCDDYSLNVILGKFCCIYSFVLYFVVQCLLQLCESVNTDANCSNTTAYCNTSCIIMK